MKFRKIRGGYIIRLLRGEEIIETIRELAARESIPAAFISGIGAAGSIICGYFDTSAKKYIEKSFEGDLEILALNGNVSWVDNQPFPHIHIQFSDTGMEAHGGHLISAVVSATCEIHLQVFEEKLERKHDEETGLNLLDI